MSDMKIKEFKRAIYETSDGKEFFDHREALAHEEMIEIYGKWVSRIDVIGNEARSAESSCPQHNGLVDYASIGHERGIEYMCFQIRQSPTLFSSGYCDRIYDSILRVIEIASHNHKTRTLAKKHGVQIKNSLFIPTINIS